MREYGVKLTPVEEVKDVDCIIVAVAHNEFVSLGLEKIKTFFANRPDCEKVLLDVKGLFDIHELDASGLKYWRL